MSNSMGYLLSGTIFTFECPHCGRQWQVQAHATGFVKSAAYTHEAGCAKLTPAERRARNAKDEKRWSRRPPIYSIANDPGHPGLHDAARGGGR